jgi:uncharacterized protein involved in tolerance to divalent cations
MHPAADSLSHKLVESKLAACVNILPGITSVYFWSVWHCQWQSQLEISHILLCSTCCNPKICPTSLAGLPECREGKVNTDAELLLVIKSRK